MRVHHQPAYILLNRAYSETSWIVEVFSRDHGRLALMAKGARRVKSRIKGVLLPFQPVLLSWTGKGEIPTLTSAEIQTEELNMIDYELRGDPLVCGFYCNELIVYLLHRHDPHPKLFEQYHKTILGLCNLAPVAGESKLAATLREFEQMIIKETGYEVSFKYEADGTTQIRPDVHYQFVQSQGFVRVVGTHKQAIEGSLVLALQPDNIDTLNHQDMSASKHLMRDILNQALGYKKILSRDIFFPKQR